MIWADISRGGRTDPHIVIKDMMTGLCYRDDILEVYVRPYAGAIGPVHPYGRQRSTSSCQGG